jgi:hypothetical protein
VREFVNASESRHQNSSVGVLIVPMISLRNTDGSVALTPSLFSVLILRSAAKPRVSKDGGKLCTGGHPSRRPLRGLLRGCESFGLRGFLEGEDKLPPHPEEPADASAEAGVSKTSW